MLYKYICSRIYAFIYRRGADSASGGIDTLAQPVYIGSGMPVAQRRMSEPSQERRVAVPLLAKSGILNPDPKP